MIKKIAKKILLLISSVVLVLLVSHFLFYLVLLDVFSFLPIFPYAFLIILLSFSFISVFLAQFLVNRFDNGYTASFYFLIASWIGIAWQAFLAYFVIIILRFVLGLFAPVDFSIFSWFFIGLTAIFSLYGFYNAFSPENHEVKVEIENLPDFWLGKKIVHLSDVHIGAIYRQKFMARIVSEVEKIKPEMVLITGDLFDGTEGDFSQSSKELLALHAPSGVHFVCGNHEGRLIHSGPVEHLTGSGIEVLDNRLEEIHGLQILGVTHPLNGIKTFDLAEKIKSLSGFNSKKPSILMFHEPIQFSSVAEIGVDLYLAGHTHYGQMFPFNFISNLAYQGYSRGVRKFKQMTGIISTGVGTWGPPLRTLSRSEIVVITLLRK
ncbi:MAG: metallophosphoesterase [Candidatus Falkowbacteria bacterium]|nr:metallophosphoesterase [Candidatus Falkowbacteria bacterium]